MPCYLFSVAYTAKSLHTNFCIFKSEKRASDRSKISPPSPSNVLFFMLFLTCYQMLTLTKKPQCIKVLKFWEIANAFFEILQDGAKHLEGYLGLVTPFDFFAPVLTCATGSDIFSTNHMFPNPVVPFTYPPTSLSLKLKNSFPENVFLEDLRSGCTDLRMCIADNSSKEHVLTTRDLGWIL